MLFSFREILIVMVYINALAVSVSAQELVLDQQQGFAQVQAWLSNNIHVILNAQSQLVFKGKSGLTPLFCNLELYVSGYQSVTFDNIYFDCPKIIINESTTIYFQQCNFGNTQSQKSNNIQLTSKEMIQLHQVNLTNIVSTPTNFFNLFSLKINIIGVYIDSVTVLENSLLMNIITNWVLYYSVEVHNSQFFGKAIFYHPYMCVVKQFRMTIRLNQFVGSALTIAKNIPNTEIFENEKQIKVLQIESFTLDNNTFQSNPKDLFQIGMAFLILDYVCDINNMRIVNNNFQRYTQFIFINNQEKTHFNNSMIDNNEFNVMEFIWLTSYDSYKCMILNTTFTSANHRNKSSILQFKNDILKKTDNQEETKRDLCARLVKYEKWNYPIVFQDLQDTFLVEIGSSYFSVDPQISIQLIRSTQGYSMINIMLSNLIVIKNNDDSYSINPSLFDARGTIDFINITNVTIRNFNFILSPLNFKFFSTIEYDFWLRITIVEVSINNVSLLAQENGLQLGIIQITGSLEIRATFKQSIFSNIQIFPMQYALDDDQYIEVCLNQRDFQIQQSMLFFFFNFFIFALVQTQNTIPYICSTIIFYGLTSTLSFKDCDFINVSILLLKIIQIDSLMTNAAIYADSKTLQISTTNFLNINMKNNLTVFQDGNAIKFVGQSINITQSNFIRIRSSYGGAISCKLNTINSKFNAVQNLFRQSQTNQNNQMEGQGGVAYISVEAQNVHVLFERIKIINSFAQSNGSFLYLETPQLSGFILNISSLTVLNPILAPSSFLVYVYQFRNDVLQSYPNKFLCNQLVIQSFEKSDFYVQGIYSNIDEIFMSNLYFLAAFTKVKQLLSLENTIQIHLNKLIFPQLQVKDGLISIQNSWKLEIDQLYLNKIQFSGSNLMGISNVKQLKFQGLKAAQVQCLKLCDSLISIEESFGSIAKHLSILNSGLSIVLLKDSGITIDTTQIVKNQLYVERRANGTGIYAVDTELVLIKVIIYGNLGSVIGGGIYFQQSESKLRSQFNNHLKIDSLSIVNCNLATFGNQIYAEDTTPSFDYYTFKTFLSGSLGEQEDISKNNSQCLECLGVILIPTEAMLSIKMEQLFLINISASSSDYFEVYGERSGADFKYEISFYQRYFDSRERLPLVKRLLINIEEQDSLNEEKFSILQNSRITKKYFGIEKKFKNFTHIRINFQDTLRGQRSLINKTIILKINFRQCKKGEQYQIVNNEILCKRCDGATYTMRFDQTLCNSCPIGGVCSDGILLGAQPNYWRSNEDDDFFIECKNAIDSCTGMPQICQQGYIGPLCETCDIMQEQYFRANGNKCLNCIFTSIQLVGMIILIVVCVLAIILSVYLTYSGNINSLLFKYLKNMGILDLGISVTLNSGIFIKLQINHFQVYKFQGVSQKFIYLQDLSILCLFQILQEINLKYFISQHFPFLKSIAYFDLIWIQIQPILMIMLMISAYCFINVFSKTDRFKAYICQLIIFYNYWFILPQINQLLISLMSCRKISQTWYLSADLTRECYDEIQLRTLAFLIPLYLIYIVAFPVAIVLKLRQNINQLFTFNMQPIYGLLYKEYKKPFFYFEFIKMIEKFMISLVLIFLIDFPVARGTYIICILIIYSMLTEYLKPYFLQWIVSLDQFSNIVLIFTLAGVTIANELTEELIVLQTIIMVLLLVLNIWYTLSIIRAILLLSFRKRIDFIQHQLRQLQLLERFMDKYKILRASNQMKISGLWIKLQKYVKRNFYDVDVGDQVNNQSNRNFSDIDLTGLEVKQMQQNYFITYQNSEQIVLEFEVFY